MKSLMSLIQRLLAEAGNRDGICTDRDWLTIQSRVEEEGLSFLTITLPAFCKDFEKSLEDQQVGSGLFSGFKRRGGLPVFLSGFLSRIFDRSGHLLSHPDVDAIQAVRQITLLFSKIDMDCSPRRTRKALMQYVQCDHEVGQFVRDRNRSFDSDLRRIASMLYGEALQDLESEFYSGSFGGFLPKHGPGATADYLVGNQKFNQSEWPRRLDSVFPAEQFLLSNWRYLSELDSVDLVEPRDERPVRVVTVPKSMKTPRIIAIEPTAMQYAQQAVLRRLVLGIESIDHLKRSIGLLDQTPNQRLAQVGSLTGSLATLDLSEASDRVSMDLVRTVFGSFPGFLEIAEATRSTRASVHVVKDDLIIDLHKFASMGSALCFPVEAMVFLAIIFLSVEQKQGARLSLRQVSSMAGTEVRVFGDDLIVPSDIAPLVAHNLELFGLKVNYRKSFWNGSFRESCGKDWYNGEDVSIVRFRRPFPRGKQNAEEIVSLVSFRNQLYSAGYWETCQWLDSQIVEVLPHFPIVESSSPAVGRWSFSFEPMAERIHPDLHTPLVRGYAIKARTPVNSIDGHSALLKYFVSPSEDPKHLERSGRPLSVYLKRGWWPVA